MTAKLSVRELLPKVLDFVLQRLHLTNQESDCLDDRCTLTIEALRRRVVQLAEFGRLLQLGERLGQWVIGCHGRTLLATPILSPPAFGGAS